MNPRPRSVIVVALPDVQALDVVGPVEVFAMANRYGADPAYATALVSASGEPIVTSSGMSLATARVSRRGSIDTLLVAGGTGTAAVHASAGWAVAVQRPAGRAPAGRQPLREALAFVAEHPEADLSVPALAQRSAMSVRTFARAFRHEVGTTPAAFVQRSRVEAARRLLETSDRTVDDIARACGFGTVETMHRAFQRTLRTTPGQYRRLFAVPA